MRGRVMTPDLATPPIEHSGANAFAGDNFAADDDTVMCDRFAQQLRVFYLKRPAAGFDRSAIADLAAAFGVERRRVENDHTLLSRRERRNRCIVTQQRYNFPATFQPF